MGKIEYHVYAVYESGRRRGEGTGVLQLVTADDGGHWLIVHIGRWSKIWLTRQIQVIEHRGGGITVNCGRDHVAFNHTAETDELLVHLLPHLFNAEGAASAKPPATP